MTREDKVLDFINNDKDLQKKKKNLNANYKGKELKDKALMWNCFAVAKFDFVVNNKIEKPLLKSNTFSENLILLKNKYM